jgi:hypothetical protein
MANNNHGVSPLAAGLGGAVVGAAVGIAALEAVKHKEEIGQKVGEIKEKGEEVVEHLEETVIAAKKKMNEFSSLTGHKTDQVKEETHTKA